MDNRKEEIVQVAELTIPIELIPFKKYFIKGAQWSDNHPRKGLVTSYGFPYRLDDLTEKGANYTIFCPLRWKSAFSPAKLHKLLREDVDADRITVEYIDFVKETELSHSEVTKKSDQELTDFEKSLRGVITSELCNNFGDMSFGISISDEETRFIARKILPIARKQLQPEFDKELELAYKNQDEVVYNRGYDKGYNEAIEDACKWLEENADGYTWYLEEEGESGMNERFLRDFREALEKGEQYAVLSGRYASLSK